MGKQPGTGKAVRASRGQILRIEQIEGRNAFDFNCFNLHDYKEFMHCGRTARCTASIRARARSVSAPPRERALLYILDDTYGRTMCCFPAASAYVL